MTDFDDEVEYDDDGIEDFVGLDNKASEGFNFLEDDEENSDMVDPLVADIIVEHPSTSYSILPTTAYLISDTIDYSQLALFDFFREFINNGTSEDNDTLVETGILELESLADRTDSVGIIDDYLSQLGNIRVNYCGDEYFSSGGFINDLIDISINSSSTNSSPAVSLLMDTSLSGAAENNLILPKSISPLSNTRKDTLVTDSSVVNSSINSVKQRVMSELATNSKYGISSLNTIPDGYGNIVSFDTSYPNTKYSNYPVSLIRAMLKKSIRTTNNNRFAGIQILIEDKLLTEEGYSDDNDNRTYVKTKARIPDPHYKILLPYTGVGYTYENKVDSVQQLNKTQYFDITSNYKKIIKVDPKQKHQVKKRQFKPNHYISLQGNNRGTHDWFVRSRGSLYVPGIAPYTNTNGSYINHSVTTGKPTLQNIDHFDGKLPQYKVKMPTVAVKEPLKILPTTDQYLMVDDSLYQQKTAVSRTFNDESWELGSSPINNTKLWNDFNRTISTDTPAKLTQPFIVLGNMRVPNTLNEFPTLSKTPIKTLQVIVNYPMNNSNIVSQNRSLATHNAIQAVHRGNSKLKQTNYLSYYNHELSISDKNKTLSIELASPSTHSIDLPRFESLILSEEQTSNGNYSINNLSGLDQYVPQNNVNKQTDDNSFVDGQKEYSRTTHTLLDTLSTSELFEDQNVEIDNMQLPAVDNSFYSNTILTSLNNPSSNTNRNYNSTFVGESDRINIVDETTIYTNSADRDI